MNLNVSIIASPATPSNFLVAAVYDPSAPTVVVQYIALPKPYTGAPITVTFTALNTQVYNFILWENSTATVGGVNRNYFSINPTQNTVQIRADLVLTTDGGGLTTGTNSYTDASLSGWAYDIERRGVGTLVPVTEYTTTATSFTLATAGDVFNQAETIILHFLPKTVQASIPAPPPFISATRILTVNTSLTNADMGTGILIQSASASITVTLPALSTVVDNKPLYLFSAGGSHINAVCAPAGADTLMWPYSNIILGQYEQAIVFKANGTWNVGNASEGILKAGEFVESYSKNPATMVNTVFLSGVLLLRSVYPRLFAFVQTLQAEAMISEAFWGATDANGNFINKAKFTLGDGSTNFRLGLQYGFVRGIDGTTRFPADFQADMVGPHSHSVPVAIVGGAGTYGGRTGTLGAATVTGTNTGTETAPKNIGVYRLIRV